MEKKLRRSKRDRVFLGVLGGLAEYLGLDPTLVRLLFIVLLVFYPGQMLLTYILAAVLMPEGDGEGEDIGEKLNRLASEVEERMRDVSGEGADVIGLLLLLLGVFLLGRAFMPAVSSQTILAVVFIIIGLLLLRGDRK